MKQLTGRIESISQTIGGTFGISARHAETDWQFNVNESQFFCMASTYKIPIAIYCLHLVENHQLSLSQMYPIQADDLSHGSGILHKRFDYDGITLSLNNLLRLMLEISDNTATDIILRICGGPQKVLQYLKDKNIHDIRINRTTKEIFADKITPPPGNTQDIGTAAAMTHLMWQLLQQKLLSTEHTQLLLNILQRCETGLARIPALLPAASVIAQKTGSTSVITNDVGIIKLPENLGHLILTVYIHAADTTLAKREQTIALIAKTLFDYLSFSNH